MTVSPFRQSATVMIAAVLFTAATLPALPSFAQANSSPTTKTVADTAPVNGKVIEDIVARVNDQIVTESDYNRASEQLDAEAKQQAVPAQQVAQKQADLLRDLIDQQLLLSKGKELGITGETELIKRLDDIRKQNHLETLEDLEKAAQQQGVSYEDFKANIRNGIITQQVVRDEVGRHITMNPADVQKYYKSHESEFAQPESVNLNEILVPTPAKTAADGADTDQVTAAQAQADAIEAKLKAGGKFEDQAKPAPADPLAPKSVALGEFRRGMLAKDIEDKAFALNAGQYTAPIRTKQGFIILQVTDHTQGGDASFKKAEQQVQEAMFEERMQPALRVYLTKLREEAFVELKPGAVDSGASGNEMRLSYSAYTPPAEKKKKKFTRTRFRGRDRSRAVTTAAATPSAPPAALTAAAAAPATPKPATQQASSKQSFEKPGKREKIRFGQAPRESLPNSQVATAAPPDNTPTVTVPEQRVVNPDGTISAPVDAAPERKTRLSARPPVKKVKSDKSPDAPPETPADELANQKVQNAPLGLADAAAQKKSKQKGDKTRYSARPKAPEENAPYLGKPVTPSTGDAPTTPAGTQHPDPATNPPAPPTSPPDPIPPGAQQP